MTRRVIVIIPPPGILQKGEPGRDHTGLPPVRFSTKSYRLDPSVFTMEKSWDRDELATDLVAQKLTSCDKPCDVLKKIGRLKGRGQRVPSSQDLYTFPLSLSSKFIRMDVHTFTCRVLGMPISAMGASMGLCQLLGFP